jgi:hypothetical protein
VAQTAHSRHDGALALQGIASLLLLGVVACSCERESAAQPGAPSDGKSAIHSPYPLTDVYVTFRLSPGFAVRKGAAIVIGWEDGNVGDPVEAFEHLYLEKQGRYKRIDHLSDVRDQVVIGTAESALSFARLVTSPRTFHLFPWSGEGDAEDKARWALEVVLRDQVDRDLVYGDGSRASHLRDVPDGYFGVLSRETAEKCGISGAAVTEVGGGFQVDRYVIIRGEGHKAVVLGRVKEKVGKGGEYELLECDEREAPREAHFLIPTFE